MRMLGCPVANGEGPCCRGCGGGWAGTRIRHEAMLAALRAHRLRAERLGCGTLEYQAREWYREEGRMEEECKHERCVVGIHEWVNRDFRIEGSEVMEFAPRVVFQGVGFWCSECCRGGLFSLEIPSWLRQRMAELGIRLNQ
jgi:hypothetical protein